MFKNQIIFIICVISTTLLISAGSTKTSNDESLPKLNCEGQKVTKDTPNTKEPGIITADHYLYHSECYENVFSTILKESNKPFVLFVHGRGEHPSKELKKKNKLIEKIQNQYQVTSIMFTWSSWCGSTCFPELKAKEAGVELTKILRILQKIKASDEYSRPYSLLTHSMGGIVISEIDTLPKFLDNLVISASAAEYENHSLWVDKIGLAKRIYIASNESDSTLKCLEGKGFKFGAPCRLGFNETDRAGRWTVKRANNQNIGSEAIYFGFDGALGDKHRYYINQKNTVFDFYDAVLKGKPAPVLGFDEIINNRVYKIR